MIEKKLSVAVRAENTHVDKWGVSGKGLALRFRRTAAQERSREVLSPRLEKVSGSHDPNFEKRPR